MADYDPDAKRVAVWTQHTMRGAGRSVVRWYEVIPVARRPRSTRQRGTITDGQSHLFNAAIAPATSGTDVVMQYNASGTGLLPQVRARSRSASTPLGRMPGRITLGGSEAASADYTCVDNAPVCRWGDYSGASPDPTQQRVVGGTNQLLGPVKCAADSPSGPCVPTQPHWRTRIFALSPGP